MHSAARQEVNAVRSAIALGTILVVAMISGVSSPAKEVVEIRLRTAVWSAPATVPIIVAVEPGADNRALFIEADGEDYYRSSEVELDGEKEKRLHTIEFKSLPAGAYVLRAEVRSDTKVLGTSQQKLLVTGARGEF